jgi:hypothetical protein
MVNPSLRERFAQLGVPMIPLTTGARLFVDELAGGDRGQVELVLGGEPRPDGLMAVGSLVHSQDFEIHLDAASHAHLVDHTISGTVVVPLALVVEWFAQALRSFRPDLAPEFLDDLRVVRGLKLERFGSAGTTCLIRCAQRPDGDLDLALLGRDGAPHYQAQAGSGRRWQPPAGAEPLPGLGPWGATRIYGDVLFHGPAFQVIETIEGCGDAGIQAWVRGVRRASWPAGPWRTDPLALDAAAQLAVLWAREHGGGAFLPMGFERLDRVAALPAEGPLRVRVRCRRRGPATVVAEALVLDAGGSVLMDLRGLELVQRPEGR